MNENDYILLPLDEVSQIYSRNGYKVKLINNNFNVSGDRKLVTNIKIEKDICNIYYGEFKFDLGGASSEQK